MANTNLHTHAGTPHSEEWIQPAPSLPTRDRSQCRANTTQLRHDAIDNAAHATALVPFSGESIHL
jgi:hypothetical protein